MAAASADMSRSCVICRLRLTRRMFRTRRIRIMPRIESRQMIRARGTRLYELACERDLEGIVGILRHAGGSTILRNRFVSTENKATVCNGRLSKSADSTIDPLASASLAQGRSRADVASDLRTLPFSLQ
jgi:hypothetical protein